MPWKWNFIKCIMCELLNPICHQKEVIKLPNRRLIESTVDATWFRCDDVEHDAGDFRLTIQGAINIYTRSFACFGLFVTFDDEKHELISQATSALRFSLVERFTMKFPIASFHENYLIYYLNAESSSHTVWIVDLYVRCIMSCCEVFKLTCTQDFRLTCF